MNCKLQISYADMIEKHLFHDHSKKPIAIFSEKECEMNYYYNQKTNKPLIKLANRIGRGDDISRMILIDDIESNGSNNPCNFILIKMYHAIHDENIYQLCGIHDAVLYRLAHILCNFFHDRTNDTNLNVADYVTSIQNILDNRIR